MKKLLTFLFTIFALAGFSQGTTVTVGGLSGASVANADSLNNEAPAFYLNRVNHAGVDSTNDIHSFQDSVTANTNVTANTTHKTSDGSDHSFIDQGVNTVDTPTYRGIQFTPITGVSHSEGLLFYDSDTKTFSGFIDRTDVTLNIGEEQWTRVVNKSGGNFTDGQVIYLDSAQGNRPTVLLAKADVLSTSQGTIAVLTEDVDDNEEGIATTFGLVRSFNTTGFDAGDELYLSAASAGAIVNTKPTAPNFVIRIGWALNSTANGAILVNISVFGDGSNNTFIDQDVTSGSSPTFDGSNITGMIADTISGDIAASQIVDFQDSVTANTNVTANTVHRTSNGSDHSFIDQDVTNGSSPTLDGVNITGINADTATIALDSDSLDSQVPAFYLNRVNHTGVDSTNDIHSFQDTVTANTNVTANTTHRTSDGSDHSFIDQNVTSTGSPTFNVVTADIGGASPITIDVTGTGNSFAEVIQDNNAGRFNVGRTTGTEFSKLSITDGGSDNLPGMIALYDDGGTGHHMWMSTDNKLRVAAPEPTDDDTDGFAIIDNDDGTIGATNQNLSVNDITFDNGATITNNETDTLSLTETVIRLDGEIILNSYIRHHDLTAGSATSGPTVPSSVSVGTFRGLSFDADNKSVNFPVEVATEWDETSDMTLVVHWHSESGDIIANGETVKFDATYRSTAVGEAVDNGTAVTATATFTGGASEIDKEHYETSITIDFDNVNQPLSINDDIGFQFDRDVSGDTYSGAAIVYKWDLVYSANRTPRGD